MYALISTLAIIPLKKKSVFLLIRRLSMKYVNKKAESACASASLEYYSQPARKSRDYSLDIQNTASYVCHINAIELQNTVNRILKRLQATTE